MCNYGGFGTGEHGTGTGQGAVQGVWRALYGDSHGNRQGLFDIRKESNPCSLCAKMRKGALNETAKELGCNKIAYAHHRDDVIETMLMSLFYEGRFYSFSPHTYLDRMDLTVIRPFLFVTEADIVGLKNKYQLPVCKNPCPMDGYTQETNILRHLIKELQKDNPHLKDCMFHAILDGNINGMAPGG